MSFALTNLSRWLLKGKQKEPKLKNGASLNPASELNLWESETLKFLRFGGNSSSRSSKPKRVKRKLEQQKIVREHDVVIVPSDGGCISDSDSDASDWSIGWSEPHAPGFLSDDDSDGGFGVLVPCYGSKNRDAREGMRGFRESKVNAADRFSAELLDLLYWAIPRSSALIDWKGEKMHFVRHFYLLESYWLFGDGLKQVLLKNARFLPISDSKRSKPVLHLLQLMSL